MKKFIYLGFAMFILAACSSESNYPESQNPPPPPPPPSGTAEFSATLTLDVPLSGNQEVPRVHSAQVATGKVELDEDLMQIRAMIDLSDVNGVEDAHIHSGNVGINGPVVFHFKQVEGDGGGGYYGYGTSSESGGSGVWEIAERAISEAQLELLKSGGMYINVHTAKFPDGEIRGQILTDNFVLATFPISGAQEVPAVSTEAFGDGYAVINTDNFDVHLVAVTSGVELATMAHIHTGRIGNNGGVLVDLVQSAEHLGTWATPENTRIDEETLAVLASGGHYVNIHTPAHPSGELRGQILTDNFVLATFELSGAQEVPSVATTASGDGYALINTEDFSVELVALTEGVENATMAHIHTGRVGENGGVLVDLQQVTSEPGKWVTPAETVINAEILAVLASGGHYVNVHTPAHPAGELRGQIISASDYVLFAFPLSGEQEVPAVDTNARGDGYALVRLTDFALELNVLTTGVANATAAHVHTGAAGENGPVLVGLERDEEDANRWVIPADTQLTQSIFDVLAAGGHYVNVHTPAFPDGEIRGQIE
jgi:hypothetical protein